MQGTRLPDAVLGEPGPGWEAWEAGDGRPGGCECPLGAYMKVTLTGYANSKVIWYIKDPDGKIGSIGRHHIVVEHDDNTITVSPSIDHKIENWVDDKEFAKIIGQGWHGWLEHGIWRSS